MLPRKIISSDRTKIKKGFDKVVEVVGSTYGPGGHNVALGRDYNTAMVTNDGVSVAKHVYLDDEIEDVGAGFVRDLTYEADQGGGDGTTTAAVLAGALLNEAWNEIFPGGIETANPKVFSKTLEKLRDDVCAKLDKMARSVDGYDDIKNVATISVESDEYGTMIADMFKTVGEHGYIYVEHDYGFEIKTKIIDGFQIDAGLSSVDYSIQGAFTSEIGLGHVIASSIEVDIQIINKIFTALAGSNISGVALLAPSFTEEALATLNHLFKSAMTQGKDNSKLSVVIPISMPVTYREVLLRDVCALSGARFLSDFNDFEYSDIGQPFKKILIKKNKTYFIGAPNSVDAYVQDLQAQKADMVKADIERMDKRIARLTGSVGIIKVGGETDAERLYWYHKIKDAVNATRSAIKEGVVPGAGIALKNLADLNPALSAPYEILCDNLGKTVKESDKIIDSVAVVKNSVRKAISAVIQVLLTKYVVTNRKPTMEEESRLFI